MNCVKRHVKDIEQLLVWFGNHADMVSGFQYFKKRLHLCILNNYRCQSYSGNFLTKSSKSEWIRCVGLNNLYSSSAFLSACSRLILPLSGNRA